MCPKLPKDLRSDIRSFSGDTGYEPTPTATLMKDLHFWVDHGTYIFPQFGIDGYVSTVVFVLHAHFKQISRYNMAWLGDNAYKTAPIDCLRFVHIDRDGFLIKAPHQVSVVSPHTVRGCLTKINEFQ